MDKTHPVPLLRPPSDRDYRSQQRHFPGHVPVCFLGTLVCFHLRLCLASRGCYSSPLPPWNLSQKQASHPLPLSSLEPRLWQGIRTLSLGGN